MKTNKIINYLIFNVLFFIFSTSVYANSCENYNVQNNVIELFKQYDSYYKYIAKNTISNIQLLYPSMSFYNKDIKKYGCTGEIIVTSTTNGFYPSSNSYDNPYYSLVHISTYGIDKETLKDYKIDFYKKNTKYKCPIEYTVQNQYPEKLISITECINNSLFSPYGDGTFTCEGNCNNVQIGKSYSDNKKSEELNELQKLIEMSKKRKR